MKINFFWRIFPQVRELEKDVLELTSQVNSLNAKFEELERRMHQLEVAKLEADLSKRVVAIHRPLSQKQN